MESEVQYTLFLILNKNIYEKFFAINDCQKFREVNRILFYDGLNPDFVDTLNPEQLEVESQ